LDLKPHVIRKKQVVTEALGFFIYVLHFSISCNDKNRVTWQAN